jgi:translocation and assembly module TamB
VLIERLVAKADAGRLQVSGRAGTEALDVSVVMQKLPARLAGAYDPALGLEGHLDGKVSIRGKPDAPIATADIKWLEAAAAATRAQYLPPLTLAMTAKLTDGVVKSEVTAGGVAGLDLKLTGQLDVEKKRTDINVGGQIPMSLANAALADRNAQVSGTLRVAANVSGPLEAPQLQGELRVEAGSISDPGSGLRLEGMTGSARFTRTSLTIERISASSAKGGSLNVAGTVSMPAEGPAVVEARVLLAELKFDDREMLAGEVDGDVNLRGALDALRATGAIRIKRLDITVPNQLPRSIAELDIQHVNASKTSYAARSQIETLHNNERQSFVTLDLDVQAANRIFVRGRGLDVQLGGALRLQGTSARPIANGGFVIERGRLDILGRQLDFKHGRLNFTGDLEPNLDMQASADADGVTISVLVTGPASKPKFRFSSVPALPEDEVVARLLFNKSLAKLSPVQLAQLAGEIDKIGGLSSGPSTLDQVKGALGVDVLDVGTNDNNATEVSAGKYVGEGTYVGVRQGSSATSSRVVIDHDLTKNLKARGELGADGNSKIGVGVEWDY